MESKTFNLDGNILWTGVRRAKARSGDPIICLIRQETIKFIARSGQQLVVSWEYTLPRPANGYAALVIPTIVSQLMSTEAIKMPVDIRLEGHRATLVVEDPTGSCEVGWRSDLADFPALPEFKQFITIPSGLIEVGYLTLSDAVHRAIAKLVTMESTGQAQRDKLAILIDFGPQKLIVDGIDISSGEAARYYFDPRLIVRALEFAKSKRLGMAVVGLPARNQAILSVVANRGNCQVHCALLSIGLGTQGLRPASQNQALDLE